MASNVRVKLDDVPPNASPKVRDYAFKKMLTKFRKLVMDNGVISTWKKYQTHETKGEKRRRKTKEARLQHKKDNINGR